MAKFEEPIGKKFSFPKSIFNQIDECSPRGYILFYIDAEGSQQIQANFQTQTDEMGLRFFASKVLNSIDTIENVSMSENIINSSPEEDSETED